MPAQPKPLPPPHRLHLPVPQHVLRLRCPHASCPYAATSKWHLNRHVTAVHINGHHPMRGKWKYCLEAAAATSVAVSGPPRSPVIQVPAAAVQRPMRQIHAVPPIIPLPAQSPRRSQMTGKITDIFPQRKPARRRQASLGSRSRFQLYTSDPSKQSSAPRDPPPPPPPAAGTPPSTRSDGNDGPDQGVCYIFGQGFMLPARPRCAASKASAAAATEKAGPGHVVRQRPGLSRGGTVLNLCSLLNTPEAPRARTEITASKGTRISIGVLRADSGLANPGPVGGSQRACSPTLPMLPGLCIRSPGQGVQQEGQTATEEDHVFTLNEEEMGDELLENLFYVVQ